jgi:energy-coupling factor transport system ATP-binding protein
VSLIDIEGLRFRYAGAAADALSGVDLAVESGEFVAVVGANGSGKSTLGRLLGGLARPADARRALVCGHDLTSTEDHFAVRRDVGVLFQNPDNQLVGATVEEDLAFGLENIALPSPEIALRVDDMLTRFDLGALRGREPHLLSGGQRQRTALAGVLAVPRRVLVMDEPTAMLDPAGRDEVLAAVRAEEARGLTVVFITQEMDEVLLADRVVALAGGRAVFDGPPAGLFARHALLDELSLGLPPAAELGLALLERGIVPELTLTLDELVVALGARSPDAVRTPTAAESLPAAATASQGTAPPLAGATTDTAEALAVAPLGVVCRGLSFRYDEGATTVDALRGAGLELAPGSAVALLGPTGSGKSTLLQLVRGLLTPDQGSVLLDGLAPKQAGHDQRERRIGLVFQMPEMQLFAATCRDDVAFGPRQLGWPAAEVDDAVAGALEAVGLPAASFGARHPYSLSGGEQRRLALAGVLAMRPALLLLDEPFVSLDPASRRDLQAILGDLRASGMGLVLATHDIDRAYALCDSRIVLDQGAVVDAGPWRFGAGGEEALQAHRLKPPFVVELWRRLGRVAAEAPPQLAAAAEALS